jgi:dolichyl-phosphate beta-glucosyltransferase
MISLILPTYNPGPKIDTIWKEVLQFVRSRPKSWEVIFVLDGCTDGTAERLDNLAKVDHDRRVKVQAYTVNRGKGYAVRTGLLAATGGVRVFTDVDLAYNFNDILKMVRQVSSGVQVVIAQRNHPDSMLLLPDRMLGYLFCRKVQSIAFRLATRLLLGLRHPDTQAGLKAFSAEVVERVVPELRCEGFGFDCELLLACKSAGIPVTQLPVTVRFGEGSTTSTTTGFQMLRELWTIRRRWKQNAVLGLPTPVAVAVAVPATETVQELVSQAA